MKTKTLVFLKLGLFTAVPGCGRDWRAQGTRCTLLAAMLSVAHSRLTSASAVLLLIHCHKPTAITLFPSPEGLCVVRWVLFSEGGLHLCFFIAMLSALTACYHRQARDKP